MTTAAVRHKIISIARKQDKETARVWAIEHGFAVKWTRDGIKVTPLS